VVWLDADDYTGQSNGSNITSLLNDGSGPDFSTLSGVASTKETVSGDTVVRAPSGGLYTSANITGSSNFTFYTIARPTSTTADQTFFALASSWFTKAIVLGYHDGKWMNYTESHDIADIDTTNFQLVKDTEGSTSTGTWNTHSSYTGDWKVIVVINRLLTTDEAAGIEAWLTARI
jgi:hypothetical protein